MPTWLLHLRDNWDDLHHSRPGHRFQDHYAHAARSRGRDAWIFRAGKIAVAVVLVLIGIAEMVFPGPAIAFFAVAGALLATESRTVARLMDWAELRLRALLRGARTQWRRVSGPVRAAIVVVAACTAALAAYATYRLFWD